MHSCHSFTLFFLCIDNDDDDDEGEEEENMNAECSSSNQTDMEWTDDIDAKHPAPADGDSLASFWFRTREHWLECVCEGDIDEDERADELNSRAQNMAKAWFEKHRTA